MGRSVQTSFAFFGAVALLLVLGGCDSVESIRVSNAGKADVIATFRESVREYYAGNSLGELVEVRTTDDSGHATFVFDERLADGRKLETVKLRFTPERRNVDRGLHFAVIATSPMPQGEPKRLGEVEDGIYGKMLLRLEQANR
jgi:hypothetical protein